MTSGTAVANLGPAVVEANYARVPLIVLSANRPYELLGTGANQTMEQLGYFGTQVRATISLGLAEDAPERMDSLQRHLAIGHLPSVGGRHRFSHRQRRPRAVRHPAARAAWCPTRNPHGAATPQGRPGGRPWTYTPPVTFDQPLDIDLTPDTVVIAGHGAGVHPNLAAAADRRRADRPARRPTRCTRWRCRCCARSR